MNYPEWLPKNLREKFDRAKEAEPKNNFDYVLLRYNPNYESVDKKDIKVGEKYVFGRPITSGPYEGHIVWSDFKPQSQEEIDNKHVHFSWFTYKEI